MKIKYFAFALIVGCCAFVFTSCFSNSGSATPLPKSATNLSVANIGDIYYSDDTTSSPQDYDPSKKAIGVVCGITNGYIRNVISLKEASNIVWAPVDTQGFDTSIEKNDYNGKAVWSWLKRQNLGADNKPAENYPAFYWCEAYDSKYSTGGKDWYLPAIYELYTIFEFRNAINEGLRVAGGDLLKDDFYWSASQHTGAHYVRVGNLISGEWESNRIKSTPLKVRAVFSCF